MYNIFWTGYSNHERHFAIYTIYTSNASKTKNHPD